ncbi:MAG TPA: (E)-4-hydroxy-3-methylbut-2-enyl-diphosphate synthase [Flavobacteriales bacterium]|nr:(E)-4-hydroxy-3-methylbut-2-enyl-diphosphate synthase [Flavobacteriales bacterium]MCC6654906.1 (E)-4-hydroxy-3-methylbut-2-enyl-diphosphate synthase [Flavobacteriales bacterium]HMU12387.1 (E)-4-hydroxy-3-methylbut-2-enyl-diphosphate synthase [Flavobacteriales bacterium]HMW95627.1 (E)-4-hydroxy-3-methylbut-2-enyl-diphosphate synthase [Flavobacteriales bacterium]HNE79206.1 (E)-4-hydroxy-3-methylbut-2-enyl-diphosphate synthase [Flavobacteriales bacterium]
MSTSTLLRTDQYCPSLTRYERWRTREVRMGAIGIGGDHPIRVQSMTTTDTMDTGATVAQSIRMIQAGCELVRITAPSIKEAENLALIKKRLRASGYDTPLVADIHFTPNAAEVAARIVEKVRVNPGNYADKKKFDTRTYTDGEYAAEMERIRERFVPLVRICKEHGTAMRIGTNHGSLSDRIMNRYGDTPLGMVESAFEFLRICRDENFHDIVLSMKASNTQVMVQAYRLLVHKMMALGWDYPLHLGVTEAGDGEDGRIKSAVGIGALLEDGLGDTVRVSLTEEPEAEIPVAQALADRYSARRGHRPIPELHDMPIDPFSHARRPTREVLNIGARHVPVVIADLSTKEKINAASLFAYGYHYSVPLDKWNLTDQACDYLFIGDHHLAFEIPGTLGIVQEHAAWLKDRNKPRHYPLLQVDDLLNNVPTHHDLNFVHATLDQLTDEVIGLLDEDDSCVLLLDTMNQHGYAEQRAAFFRLMTRKCDVPVIIGRDHINLDELRLMLYSSTDMGALLLDGLGDGVMICPEKCGSDDMVNRTAFGILQATRSRISKTEYISCPSCGRTLFDLQETTARIRARTSHLKGVKIGIMGCIVNGPGEMADADYGYVGTGPGVITLYKEKTVVKRNVPSANAVDELIALIKEGGDWVEMPRD